MMGAHMLNDSYLWLKTLHIISLIAWMAGMLYLPRLFVYHTQVAPGSEASEMLKVMERRLLRFIINPAMIATWIFGLALAFKLDLFNPNNGNGGWFHAKLGLVVLMQVSHAVMARCRRQFAEDKNTHSARFYRILNEVPTVLLIGIVVLVVFKPF